MKAIKRAIGFAALMAALSASSVVRAETTSTNSGAAATEETDAKKTRKELTPEERKKRQEKFDKRLKALREKKENGSLTAKEERQLARMEKVASRKSKHPAVTAPEGAASK